MQDVSSEGTFRKLLQHMNQQVPSRRIWLSALMDLKEPSYTARDGTEYLFDREELEALQRLLKVLGQGDLKLPILLIADPSQEHSAWRVEGETECAVVSRLLDKQEGESKDKMYLYAPHMAVVRKKLPTTTVCMFLP